MDQRTKVGIIGSGSIGQSIIQDLRQRPDVELVFVLARDLDKLASLGLPSTVSTDKAEEALSRDMDLVVEAAMPKIVADLAPRCLVNADFAPSAALPSPIRRLKRQSAPQ